MMLKGLLKTQLLVHSYSEDTLQKERKKERRREGCVTSILTSGRSPVRAGTPALECGADPSKF